MMNELKHEIREGRESMKTLWLSSHYINSQGLEDS